MQAIVLEDLKAVTKFVASQMALGKDVSQVLAVQCTAMKTKLRSMKGLSISDASRFSFEVADGPWSPEQKAELADVIAELAEKGVGSKPRRKMQQLLQLENFFTAQDWHILQRRMLLHSKLTMVAMRLWLLGVSCPSEPTLHKATSLACYGQALTEHEFNQHKKELKADLKRIDKQHKWLEREPILKYPATPQELPEDVYNYAYQNSEGPVECPMESIAVSATKMRRCRSGALRDVFDQESAEGQPLAIQDIGAIVNRAIMQTLQTHGASNASSSSTFWSPSPSQPSHHAAVSIDTPNRSYARSLSPSPAPTAPSPTETDSLPFEDLHAATAPAAAPVPAPALEKTTPAAMPSALQPLMDRDMSPEYDMCAEAEIDKMESDLLMAYESKKAESASAAGEKGVGGHAEPAMEGGGASKGAAGGAKGAKAHGKHAAKGGGAPKGAAGGVKGAKAHGKHAAKGSGAPKGGAGGAKGAKAFGEKAMGGAGGSKGAAGGGMKRPAAAIVPECPGIEGEQPLPIYYKHGRILTPLAKKAFRVFVRAGQKVEYTSSWAGSSVEEAFAKALRIVDESKP